MLTRKAAYKLKDGKTDGLDTDLLTEDEKWMYFAYMNAERHFHGLSLPVPMFNADRFFSEDLFLQAYLMWPKRGDRRPRQPSRNDRIAAAYRWKTSIGEPLRANIPQNSPEIDALLAEYDEHCMEIYGPQDRAIAASRARIIGDGKNPDGTNSKEAIEHVELCSRIVRANIEAFVERSRKAFGNPRIGRHRGEQSPNPPQREGLPPPPNRRHEP
jgi:hypothetical protein